MYVNLPASRPDGVVVYQTVSDLRSDWGIFSRSTVYRTLGAVSANDGGEGEFFWDQNSVDADDGVLVLKTANPVGRMRRVRPRDLMFNALSAVPAASDVSRAKSFDPTFSVAMGTEFGRVTGILRNAGWHGIVFGPDPAGNKDYKLVNGEESVGTSTAPSVPFVVRGVGGATFGIDTAVSSETSYPIGVSAAMEPAFLGAYGARQWTQSIVGGETVFPGVADITGLAVGDWVLVRIGADQTDASGLPATFFFGQIKTITPGTGTTGMVETWQCVPEKTPSSIGSNAYRTQNRHDMVKVVGFQDGTTIEGIRFRYVFVAAQLYRNLTVNCEWETTYNFCINGLYGIGMNVPRFHVGRAIGSPSVPGSLITLAKQYDTHIGSLTVSDYNARSGSVVNILSEEAMCVGTRVETADLTVNGSSASGNNCLLVSQTPGQVNSVSFGSVIVRGTGRLSITDAAVIGSLEDRVSTSSGDRFYSLENVGTYFFNGVRYQSKTTDEHGVPLGPSVVNRIVNLPVHGMTSSLRVYASSLTGLTSIHASGDGGATEIDITSTLVPGTAGQWNNLGGVQPGGMGYPSAGGFNALRLRFTTGSSFPSGGYLILRHTVFQSVLHSPSVSHADDGVPHIVISAGTPTMNAAYFGQVCFDSTNKIWYDSVSAGAGASDWKPRS